MRLILVRHGQTTMNRDRIIQGCGSDSGLSQRGREQAGRAASLLGRQQIDAIYSSPLKRAVDTAQAIAQACQLEVNVAPGLKEVDAGDLEGVSLDDMGEQYTEPWREWIRGNTSLPLPGGESLEELQRRAWKEIERIIERLPDETVVVVSHLLVTLVVICRAIGINLRHALHLRQDPAAISIVEISAPGNSLLLFNDTCHLDGE